MLPAVGLGRIPRTSSAWRSSTGTSAPVGLATESDTAFALAAVQRLLVGVAAETDRALALSGPAPEVVAVSEAHRYDVPAESLAYDVPGSALRYEVPSMALATSTT